MTISTYLLLMDFVGTPLVVSIRTMVMMAWITKKISLLRFPQRGQWTRKETERKQSGRIFWRMATNCGSAQVGSTRSGMKRIFYFNFHILLFGRDLQYLGLQDKHNKKYFCTRTPYPVCHIYGLYPPLYDASQYYMSTEQGSKFSK
jgi:hypothetical protein